MALSLSQKRLESLAQQRGLRLFGITDLVPAKAALEALIEWQASGYAGELAYMRRDPAIFADLSRLLPGARSVLSVALQYDRGIRPELPPGYGKVARYAWGRDYHRVARKRLRSLVEDVERALGREISWRIFSDAVPMLEREIGRKAGLGFFGKNTMLIRERIGSFFFLAEVIWDVPVSSLVEVDRRGSCGTCTRCLTQCPTGAFVGEYRLDARKCISYLTIEKRGALSLWEREALGGWIFGCDECQEVCPFNHRALSRGEEPECAEFSRQCGVGPHLALSEVLELRREEDFHRRFAGTPLMRAKREGLLRNAACVAANIAAEEVTPALERAFGEDPSPLVRQHALWGLCSIAERCQMGGAIRVRSLLERGRKDGDPRVAEEALGILERGG